MRLNPGWKSYVDCGIEEQIAVFINNINILTKTESIELLKNIIHNSNKYTALEMLSIFNGAVITNGVEDDTKL